MLEQDFSKVCAQFDAAEAELAKYPGFSIYNQPAAINELRYAGHHILKASNSTKAESYRHDHLVRADRHCQRAVNDVRDEAIIVCLTAVRDFLGKQYTSQELSSIPGLMEKLDEVLKLRSILENAGMTSAIVPGGDTETVLMRMCNLHNDIKVAMEQLDSYRDEERKAREDVEEMHRRRVSEERMQKTTREKQRKFLVFLLSFLLSAFSFTALVVPFICGWQK